MVNPDSKEISFGRRQFLRAAFNLAGFGLLSLPQIDAQLPQVVNQQLIEDIYFSRTPSIIGDKIIGLSILQKKLHIIEGSPGVDNNFYFVSKGIVEGELVHNLALDPNNANRLAVVRELGRETDPLIHFSEDSWATHIILGDPSGFSTVFRNPRFSSDGRLVFIDGQNQNQNPYTAIFNPEASSTLVIPKDPANQTPTHTAPKQIDTNIYRSYGLILGQSNYKETLWYLARYFHDLDKKEERVEKIIGLDFSKTKTPKIIDSYIEPITGAQRLMIAGKNNTKLGNYSTSVMHDINPENTKTRDSTSPFYPLYPVDSSPVARGEFIICEGAWDLSSGDYYLVVDYSSYNDQTGFIVERSALEYVKGIRSKAHDLVHQVGIESSIPTNRFVKIDSLDIYNGSSGKHLIAMVDGNTHFYSIPFTTRESLNHTAWRKAYNSSFK